MNSKIIMYQTEDGLTKIETNFDGDVDYYNLDAIISLGYRVKSLRGTEFRIWANRIFKVPKRSNSICHSL